MISMEHPANAKGEQEGDEMGNTEYTILFENSPPKKHPHGVRRLPLPFSCFHYIVLCKHFPPVSPASLLTDGGDDRTQAGRDLPLTLARRLCLHEHAAAVMTFYPLFPSWGALSCPFFLWGSSLSLSRSLLLFPLSVAVFLLVMAWGVVRLSSLLALGCFRRLFLSRFSLSPLFSSSLPFERSAAVLSFFCSLRFERVRLCRCAIVLVSFGLALHFFLFFVIIYSYIYLFIYLIFIFI